MRLHVSGLSANVYRPKVIHISQWPRIKLTWLFKWYKSGSSYEQRMHNEQWQPKQKSRYTITITIQLKRQTSQCKTGISFTSDRFDLTLSRVAFQPIKSCNIPSEIRRSNSICAGFSSPSLNVCNQREPGGALICQVGSQWIQYGVMSAGIGCLGPNLPGIFANIRKCNNWISTKIGSR